MVDSSVGGKTGVNHPKGKNLIGAFNQPKAVFVDPETLKSLPKREFSAGMAEVIKYGVIKDKELFEYLEIEKKSWIIDCFKENNYPLEIAEIELSNEDEDLFLPSFISKEITGLTHYSNFSLANNPFSEWNENF